ncbi:MAG: DUF2971 domain-containing protein [Thiobacillaceae bacterium]
MIDNRIYFRSREQLNDPNELRPKISFVGPEELMRSYARNLLSRWPHRLSPAKRLHEENKLIYRFRHTPDQFEGALHEILDRVGLLCLSATAASTLLWSHYADGHRGVCIQFDAEIGLFQAAQQVRYTDRVPVINRLVDTNDEMLMKSVFTKGEDWSYEEEWRVMARWRDEDRIEQHLARFEALRTFLKSQNGPGYYDFPREAIRSVILGSRIEPSAEEWLREMLARAYAPISIKRMESSRTEFANQRDQAGMIIG